VKRQRRHRVDILPASARSRCRQSGAKPEPIKVRVDERQSRKPHALGSQPQRKRSLSKARLGQTGIGSRDCRMRDHQVRPLRQQGPRVVTF